MTSSVPECQQPMMTMQVRLGVLLLLFGGACAGEDDVGAGGMTDTGGDIGASEDMAAPGDSGSGNGPEQFVKLSVTGDATCGLTNTGRILCWGNGALVTDAPEGAGFVDLDIALAWGCALRGNGLVECWAPFVPSFAEDITDQELTTVAAGGGACGLRAGTSEAECWGQPVIQQDIPASRFQQVDIGNSTACGLREDGRVECWGLNTNFGEGDPPEDVQFQSISLGVTFGCGVELDSSLVRCWGSGAVVSPARIPTEPVTLLAVQQFEACAALRDSNQVVCWGDDEATSLLTPPALEADSISQLEVGPSHACALGNDGEVVCWGSNEFGQLDPPEL